MKARAFDLLGRILAHFIPIELPDFDALEAHLIHTAAQEDAQEATG